MHEPLRSMNRKLDRTPASASASVSALAAAVLALVAGLAGCAAVGPDYKVPPTPPVVEASFINAGASGVSAQSPDADIATFWRGFGDPALTGLVERALAVNGDIRIAQARLQEARATYQGARAEQLPSIGVSADAERSLGPEYLFPGASRSDRTVTFYDAGFTANWELDFFGRNRRLTESASSRVEASEAGIHAAHTAIAAEVARNYLNLRALQRRYQVANDSLVNQRDSLQLTAARLDVGRGTQLDVSRANSLVASTEAALPALQAAIDQTAYRLATLTAQPPRTVAEALATPQPMPNLPVTDLGAMPLGTPEQLLRRRPDLVIAERQLAAATSDIGVATADLFPRITLSGLIGFNNVSLPRLGDSESQQYSLGAALVWPLLDFGRVRSRISASEARAQQALANYEQTVSTALEETEGALTLFTRSAQQSDRLASAAQFAEEAQQLARVRYDAGVTDFLTVLDAERQTLSARDALVQSQLSQATALVSVYRALGGGWSGDNVVK